MKKAVFLFLAVMLVGGFAVKDSSAAEWCWNLGGTSYFRAVVASPDSAYPKIKSVDGLWTSGTVSIPLTGTMVKSADGTQWNIGLNGTSNFYSIHYGMQGTVDKITKTGTITVYYSDAGNYLTWDLTKINCSAIPTTAVTTTGEASPMTGN